MPAALAAQVAASCAAALRQPETAAALRAQGFDIVASTPDDYARKIADDLRRWGDLARATNIRAG